MLETEATLEIKDLIAEFRPGEGDLLAALHKIQHRYGYIPPESIPVVARHLGLGEAHVYGTTTFYSEFRLTPPAETTIAWCCGPACRVRGSDRVRAALEAVLSIGMEEKTPDNRVGLHVAQCNGTCDFAPQVWVNGRVVGPLTVGDAIRLARELKAGGQAPKPKDKGT
jgi:formate dehydrogenase subunit gamma